MHSGLVLATSEQTANVATVLLAVPTFFALWFLLEDREAIFAKIAGGMGGYWEDQGYEWYAGI